MSKESKTSVPGFEPTHEGMSPTREEIDAFQRDVLELVCGSENAKSRLHRFASAIAHMAHERRKLNVDFEQELKQIRAFHISERETDSMEAEKDQLDQLEKVLQAIEVSIDTIHHHRSIEDRIAKMRELTMKLRSPNGLADLEREPAFKRKNITLTKTDYVIADEIVRHYLDPVKTEEACDDDEKRR